MKKNSIKTVVVGLQWGDEGKGKIVDYLSCKADIVVRFNGGNNAGHTVVVNGVSYKFHHLPSGAVQRKKLLIAQGSVVNPKVLISEIKTLKKSGISPLLVIDPRVHLVMPYHQLLDTAMEKWKGKKATGSLGLGIGYCYEDRNNRTGIRFEDLLDKQILTEKIKTIFPLKKAMLEKVYRMPVRIKAKDLINEYYGYGLVLKKYLGDVTGLLWEAWEEKNILFETAHGTMLDPAFGTYPYSVAPPSTAGALYSGTGIGPAQLKVAGIVKAYTTRVGNGPFPTEDFGVNGKYLQSKGAEVGTTSGRKRRCGWLDLAMLRSSVKLNNVSYIALTKLDVLSGLKEIKIATHYKISGKKEKYFPAQINHLSEYKPVYKKVRGWSEDLTKIRRFADLPENCRQYLKIIESELQVPIKYISVAAEREAVIKV